MEVYTIRDIARLAGVSVTTVSRVLNHRPDVKKETRARVEATIAKYNFVGNENARGLKQTDNEVIGLIIRGRSNPFLNALSEAILSRAEMLPANIVTEYIDEKDDEFKTAFRLMQQRRICGLIFVGSRIDERVGILHGSDVPMVFTTVDGKNAGLPNASSVSIDDYALGCRVAEDLIACGHTRIALLGTGRLSGDSLSNRLDGVLETLKKHSIVTDDSMFRESRFSMKDGYDCAYSFFLEHPDTTAVFAMSDTIAIGAIRALRDLGKSVPDDVSVFGFDGIEIGRYTLPALTTVEQPVEEIAGTSVDLLKDMIENGAAPRHVRVNAEIIHRESVRSIL